ncbi:MAG: COX15/CtaA family protein [Pseudomonadota bacterium]|nr:COX15/CtaA family protein [Pseudomonadota bacterium]
MTLLDRRFMFLRRLALLCAATVFAVTSLSAFIRLSKEGLGCADWPQCYGQEFRQTAPGQPALAAPPEVPAAIAAARFAHRVVAVLALVLVVSMVTVCFGNRPVLRMEGALALALIALALFLAVLGRWSSGARIPAVAIGNVMGGFAMLALSLRLAAAGRPLPVPRPRVLVAAAALLLLVQVALGALVSASHAGLSCVAWADCVAGARAVDWATLNPWHEPVLGALPPFNPAGALAQVLHRGVALALVLLLPMVAWRAWCCGRMRSAVALLLGVAAQVALGLVQVQASLPLGVALLHNQLAAGLLATLVLLL